MNKLKNKKGITLIALVITIIVLLILAGVSIAMLTGDNGILTKASGAKEKSAEAEAIEKGKLLIAEWKIKKEVDGVTLDMFLTSDDYKENREAYGVSNIVKDEEENKYKVTVAISGTNYEITINATKENEPYVEEQITSSVQTPTVPEKVALTGIEVPEGKEEITIGIGEEASVEINAIMVPSNADDKLIYSSSDETKVTVDENGKVTGVAEGEVTITIAGETATTVTEEIKVTVKEGVVTVSQIINSKASYYGKQVTNYKASESDTNVYRIFYVDEAGEFGEANTVYLKADYSSTNYNLNNYASYDSVNTKIRQMNPDWANTTTDTQTVLRGNSEKDAEGNVTWNINEQAAAYLCSPVNSSNVSTTSLPWKNYFNAEYADYVIGAPSVEMYIKSYNQVPHTPDNEFSAEYSATSSPGYIYKVNGTAQNSGYYTNDNTLDYSTTYNSMYCGKITNGTVSTTDAWWLASPLANDPDYVCDVSGTYVSLNGNIYNYNGGLSPLVSLKSNFQIQVAE